MKINVPNLSDLEEEFVWAQIPFLNSEPLKIKIHRVETSGLWIENQDVTNKLLKDYGNNTTPKTIILFVPFQQIQFVMKAYEENHTEDHA